MCICRKWAYIPETLIHNYDEPCAKAFGVKELTSCCSKVLSADLRVTTFGDLMGRVWTYVYRTRMVF